MKSFKFENKIYEWISKNLLLIGIILVTVLSFYFRFIMKEFESGDLQAYLIPWYKDISNLGGFKALSTQVGNYGIPYQTLIAIMTYLPVTSVAAYKITSMIFDYAICILIAGFANKLTGSKLLAGVAYIITVINPVIFMNSSVWGQCDSIFTFFCLLCIYGLVEEKFNLAFIAYGVAFAFKLQAVFILPFVLFYIFYKKKTSIINFFWIPVMMTVLSIGGLINGRTIVEVFKIYFYQVQEYPLVSYNYPSIWIFLTDNRNESNYPFLSPYCMAVAVIALGLLVLWIVKSDFKIDKKKLIYIAFIMSYTTVFFLPSMHERYSYIYIILGLLIVIIDKKTIPAYIGLLMLDLQTYGYYLFALTIMPWIVLSIINLACFIYYCYRFSQYCRISVDNEE
ncbi:MAG: hypothetical protein K5659_07055 [Lachnospiraceae bacterium]|nr:hypothetical protein [Lachnospiraceae bacterium]